VAVRPRYSNEKKRQDIMDSGNARQELLQDVTPPLAVPFRAERPENSERVKESRAGSALVIYSTTA
jgi:hypothetical protein